MSMMKKIFFTLFSLSLIIGYMIFSWPEKRDDLKIVMLDVGQGDAFYIRTPEGRDILIDGGPDRSVLWELGSVMPPFDYTLEYVIATHPDADHIAGLAEIPEMFFIDTLITNGVQKETGVSQAITALSQQRKHIHAVRGQKIEIEKDLFIEFLHPVPSALHGDAYNNDSLVFILRYKDFSALFTGDIEMEVEEELVAFFGDALDVDMLKIPHHGSKTSTTEGLLSATSPQIALMSLGKENTFGHPHTTVLWRIEQRAIELWRTDVNGRVECYSDGANLYCDSYSRTTSLLPAINGTVWCNDSGIISRIRSLPVVAYPPACSIKNAIGFTS